MSDPLTLKQRETLAVAIESGYYEVPAEAGLEDLAESFDVSHQAISERLKRAHKTLAEDQLEDGG